ncbi:adiponectin receptor protein-like [Oppia nitens]|uniref:adiponectin receptor protein-like n=1 Tax=Oppia nitens TaxID=1686743 RepID=UPI0023DBDAE6|nr:adiponectin receptor protein-like [Oppia nitens]
MQTELSSTTDILVDTTGDDLHQHMRSMSDDVMIIKPEVKTHRRTASLRQRLENAEQLVHKFVTEAEQVAEQAVIKLCTEAWHVCHFNALPKWLQDNDFLHRGHRPPLPSFWVCFKSIFRLHTETGNIWTHGLGAVLFLCLFVYTFITFKDHYTYVDRLMLAIYFCGAITCLSFSTVFHTCSCHSREVSKFCSKLDYCGISIQIIGSMIPALYYGFYDNHAMYLTYITFGVILCIISIVISLWDKFGEPKFRPLRTAVFLAFGLSNVIPGIHWFIVLDSHLFSSFLLFILQGLLYIIGALLYVVRIPERFFPGKCDYWFQSHQLFHILVVLAAIVHLNGINGMVEMRLNVNQLSI